MSNLVADLTVEKVMGAGEGARRFMETILFPQFYCEPKMPLHNKI